MFYIYRCTTDKLDVALNAIAEAGDTIVQPVHTGGRDWVVVCRKGAEGGVFAEEMKAANAELRDAARVHRRLAQVVDKLGPSA